MKILVAIKRVVDPGVRVRPLADGSGMDIASAKMAMNPFCEIAVEEAIRLKEQGLASEVVVVSIGQQTVQDQLRSALALGADRALHITTESILEPLAIAKVLHALVQKEQPQLVLLGKQSIDGDHNQTGQMLAGLCGYPQGTFVSHIECKGDEVWVTRELDGGLQTLALKLPAVVTTDLRLNQPRYPTMPNIMKARQKPLVVIPLAELGLSLQPRLQTISIDAPKARQQGIKVNSVAELVDKLRQEAKVL
ncbi:electron transfer flavoprotein subunit beta/FixA family protein [Cellvibrio sp. OA-2007]|uniref:electron transfer flavoprotein subunit beta/FixA family protein n=1 Tax=Cellvibrio sp. OA-2007 TaxID=529823 RepID=UPI000780FAF0|nr:electron transfer flavoprotein subunit beta/FixA family protein [Cellvibrio sp. OA-2007]